MDNYKKRKPKQLPKAKKRHTHAVEKVRPRATQKNNNIKIKMNGTGKKPAVKSSAKNKMRVLLGRKEFLQRKRIVSLIITAIVVLSVLIFSLCTPTGPFEYIQTAVHSIGGGSYPLNLSGGELVNAYSIGSTTYVLTDTHAEIFNASGKKLLSRQHEFNLPVISVSEQRAMIYDRGGKSAFIFNSSDVLREISMKNDIYCAAIGRNGTYAVATKSDSYASQVEVFSKNGKSKFTWFSSDALISGVAVADNGRRIAVATVDVSSGRYKSKVLVFDITKPNAIYSFEYDNELIYSINTVSGSFFSVVTSEGLDYISWRKGTRARDEENFSISTYKYSKNRWNVSVVGNKSGNTIVISDKNGNKKSSFVFEGNVSDVSVISNRVFVLSDGYLYLLDYDGNSLAAKVNVSGYNRVVANSADSAVVIGNYGMDKITFKN